MEVPSTLPMTEWTIRTAVGSFPQLPPSCLETAGDREARIVSCCRACVVVRARVRSTRPQFSYSKVLGRTHERPSFRTVYPPFRLPLQK